MGEQVKFEAGQVVRYGGRSASYVPMLVLGHEDDGRPRFEALGFGMVCISNAEPPEILSPAPCMGDSWTSGESVVCVELDDSGVSSYARLRIVSQGEPFVGDVVAVARRLWEGGYRRVERESVQVNTDETKRLRAEYERRGYVTLNDLKARGLSYDEKQIRHFGQQIESIVKLAAATGLSTQDVADAVARVMDTELTNHVREQAQKWIGSSLLCFRALDSFVAAQARIDSTLSEAVALIADAQLPRAGEVWNNSTTAIELQECSQGLSTRVLVSAEHSPLLHVGEARCAAEFLVQQGYKRSTADVAQAARRCAQKNEQTAVESIQRILDTARAERATGDGLRKLVEPHGVVPELRAGMVVRRSKERDIRFGRVTCVDAQYVVVRWTGIDEPAVHSISHAQRCIADGRWRIVTTDVAPLASIAYAVAAIFTQPDRATSRRYVDIACAQLRGEPFAEAVRAVLVAASESKPSMSPHDIASIIQCCRAHERRRETIAPGRRVLTDEQLDRCVDTVWNANPTGWCTAYARVYERARPSCRT
jgi:hypothetical protein